ncbi:MAG: cation diffusion facilitator family transporter [Actinomycetota bacterium]|nr:cation diffusion facilitator family transporter [Actinomycetota bacterium]
MSHDHDHDHDDDDHDRRGRSHGHDHGHGVAALRAGARHTRPLVISLGLIVAFLVVQVVVGVITGSLALLSDAGHMATDALGLGMALAAIQAASNARVHPQRTFGLYRLEILAALANAVLLFGVAGYVLFEAAGRLGDAPDIDSVPVLVVGVLGLVVNLVAFLLLRAGSKESINLQGAYLEVLSDMLGSVGVILAAIVWGVTGWAWVDPVIGAAIGVFILPRAWKLGREALRVLVQAAPAGIDLVAMQAELAGITGVVDVHDLHVWTLTSEMDVATAHLMVAAGTDSHVVLDRARELLAVRHGITHATLQVEPDDHCGCDEVTW